MIATPPPVLRLPIGGTCDTNGNLTLKSIVPSRSWYGVFTAILKVSSGAPQWEIDLLGMPVGVAGGGSAVMGAVYSNPEDSFTLIVTGAAPNAVVSGGLYGFLAAEPEQLPQLGAISSGGGGGASGALPGGQALAHGSLLAVGDTFAVPVGGVSTIGIGPDTANVVQPGTTFRVEGTADSVQWFPLPIFVETALGGSQWASGINASTYLAGNFVVVACAGLAQMRLRMTAVGGGQAVLKFTLLSAPATVLPTPIGSQTAAFSMPVVIATDQTAIPVTVGSYVDQNTYAIRASGLSTGALGAGGAKVILSLWHLAGSGKTVRLRRLKLYPDSVSAASILLIELLYFGATTLPSGGTGIVPTAMVPGTAAAEATTQSLPTTVGATETAVALAIAKLSYGIIAGSVSDLFRDGFELYKHYLPDVQPPTLRSGNQEGWNLKITSSGAATILFSLVAEFTEA